MHMCELLPSTFDYPDLFHPTFYLRALVVHTLYYLYSCSHFHLCEVGDWQRKCMHFPFNLIGMDEKRIGIWNFLAKNGEQIQIGGMSCILHSLSDKKVADGTEKHPPHTHTHLLSRHNLLPPFPSWLGFNLISFVLNLSSLIYCFNISSCVFFNGHKPP